MPKLVDYAGRFEFVRQAAFAVVRDQSVEALTRRALAAELGCGVNTVRRCVDTWVHPVRLAADEVVTRRRRGRLGRRSPDPVEVADYVIRSVMPEDDLHLDEELVWLRLVAACAFRPSGVEGRGKVRHDFQIGQRGYADEDLEAEAESDDLSYETWDEGAAGPEVTGAGAATVGVGLDWTSVVTGPKVPRTGQPRSRPISCSATRRSTQASTGSSTCSRCRRRETAQPPC